MKHIPFLLQQYAQQHSLQQPVLLLCAEQKEALYVLDLLRFWLPEQALFYFPEWDVLPYDRHRANLSLVQQRLQVLAQLPHLKQGLIVTTVAALRQKIAPQSHLDRHGFYFRRDQIFPKEALRQRLQKANYREVGIVREKGEYVLRGETAVIFPLAATQPIRLQWQGERLQDLRFLNAKTHETAVLTQEILLTPPHELDLHALHQLQQKLGSPTCSWDFYLPLLFAESASLFDYLPPACLALCGAEWETALRQHQDLCAQRYVGGHAPPPEALFMPPEALLERWQTLPTLPLNRAAVQDLIFSGNQNQREQQLAAYQRQFDCQWHQHQHFAEDYSPLRHSFSYQNQAHISSWDLQTATENSTTTAEALLLNMDEIALGDPIIHRDWGVGRYEGLLLEDGQEWIKLRYADGQNVLLQPSDAALLLPYRGDPENAPWHALGSASWRKIKQSIEQEVSDTAAELLQLYAAREAAEPLALNADEASKKRFAAGFPYQLTADQSAAITAIETDLAAPKPMDRLLCGDVGFGKTEVALRAAFIAVQAGYQVALIAPTTLLAEQHEQQWLHRFQNEARLCALHRFKSVKEQKSALTALAAGEMDIVIGTHRLLQDDVYFQRLGLLIVDEEQRFGVKQKERLKTLRHNVNLLTLSATPIPRTLNMALHGLRDLSLIQTPPQGRLSVRTEWTVWNDELIREACQRELARAGQIYFLHNDVASMERVGDVLQEIVPEMRIAIAHGQMKERELEGIMRDFQEKRFDLLLSSTIIESGIDLPNANTIIINRADRLGLGQLHQLRGRVGRSHQQAYAYLLTPAEETLQDKTRKRLESFCQLESVGAGFLLASQDLEQRGAGSILGAAQSGQTQQLGIAYYLDALNHALRRLQKNESASDLIFETLEQPHFSADYIALPQQRLDYYQQLSRCHDGAELERLRRKIQERHGLLSSAAERVFAYHRLRIRAEALPLRRIEAQKTGWKLELKEPKPEQQQHLIALLQNQPHLYQLKPPAQLNLIGAAGDFSLLKNFLESFPE